MNRLVPLLLPSFPPPQQHQRLVLSLFFPPTFFIFSGSATSVKWNLAQLPLCIETPTTSRRHDLDLVPLLLPFNAHHLDQRRCPSTPPSTLLLSTRRVSPVSVDVESARRSLTVPTSSFANRFHSATTGSLLLFPSHTCNGLILVFLLLISFCSPPDSTHSPSNVERPSPHLPSSALLLLLSFPSPQPPPAMVSNLLQTSRLQAHQRVESLPRQLDLLLLKLFLLLPSPSVFPPPWIEQRQLHQERALSSLGWDRRRCEDVC